MALECGWLSRGWDHHSTSQPHPTYPTRNLTKSSAPHTPTSPYPTSRPTPYHNTHHNPYPHPFTTKPYLPLPLITQHHLIHPTTPTPPRLPSTSNLHPPPLPHNPTVHITPHNYHTIHDILTYLLLLHKRQPPYPTHPSVP